MKEAIIQYNDDPDNDGNHMVISWNPLVRCNNCKYWRKLLLNKNGDGVCHADNPIRVSNQDWFCADGERRTDDA